MQHKHKKHTKISLTAPKVIRRKGKIILKPKRKSLVKKRGVRKKQITRQKVVAQVMGFSSLVLLKPLYNPIIVPRSRYHWEAWQTFNPGVIQLHGRIHFLYRAIGQDGISRFGYAGSDDGYKINDRLPYPVYEHRLSQPVLNFHSLASGGSFGGCEDPRLVYLQELDRVFMTYTACGDGLLMAITSIKRQDFINQKWDWKPPKLMSQPGFVNKNWVIFPEKINGKFAILHSISPDISIAYRDSLDFNEGEYISSYYNGHSQGKANWDGWVRGAGAPPLKTEKGWLLFYHAMDLDDMSKYKVGALLLDLEDPTKVLHRAPQPVLEPKKEYENNGFKAGVVYVSGAIICDGELLVYYGASDSYVSMAHINLDAFLEDLTHDKTLRPIVVPLKKHVN